MKQNPSRTPLSRLGAIIRLLREEKGLNRQQLAEASGVDTKMLQEIEQSSGVAPAHLCHLDAVLAACDLRLSDLASGERRLIAGKDYPGEENGRDVETLLRTIERLQEEIESLELQLADRNSATMRAFQMQSIKLLERTMESSGMSREDMRRLVSDMHIEDAS